MTLRDSVTCPGHARGQGGAGPSQASAVLFSRLPAVGQEKKRQEALEMDQPLQGCRQGKRGHPGSRRCGFADGGVAPGVPEGMMRGHMVGPDKPLFPRFYSRAWLIF